MNMDILHLFVIRVALKVGDLLVSCCRTTIALLNVCLILSLELEDFHILSLLVLIKHFMECIVSTL